MKLWLILPFLQLWGNVNISFSQNAIRCPSIPLPDGMQVVGDLDKATFGNAVQFSCRSSNLFLEGSRVMHCNPNGEWQGTVPKCKDIKCNAPVIENGRVEGNRQEYKKDEWLTFRCNHGFKKVDNRQPKCQKLGQRGIAEWAPTPACKEITCELSQPPPPGTAYSTQNSVVSHRQTVRVTCGERYWIINDKTTEAVVTCQVDGEWDTWPVCKEVTCSGHLPEDNLSWTTNRNTWGRNRLGDTVSYSCAWSYERTDGAQHATCTRDGWTPKPLCRATSVPCPHPDFENAVITYGVKDSYNRNDQVRYRCQTGNGETFTATCREGAWTESTGCAASCPPPDFQDADIIHGAKYNYISDDQVRYRCRSGNRETFTAICKEGTWAEAKKCAGYCENLEDGKLTIRSDVKETYMEGESINYECNAPGEVIEGTASCSNGLWSKSIECPDQSGCGRPPSLTDGETVRFTEQQYENGDTVEYTCYNMYVLKGGRFKTCNNGVWTGEMTCMKPCIVNAEMMERHNIEFSRYDREKYYAPHEDHLTFVCKYGTRLLHQEPMRKQCINGQMDLPTCG